MTEAREVGGFGGRALWCRKRRDGPLMATISAWSFRPGDKATTTWGSAAKAPRQACTVVRWYLDTLGSSA